MATKVDTGKMYAMKVLRKEHLIFRGASSVKQAITEKQVPHASRLVLRRAPCPAVLHRAFAVDSTTAPQTMATKGVHMRAAHSEGRCSVAYSPDGKQLITSGADMLVKIFEAGDFNAEPRKYQKDRAELDRVELGAHRTPRTSIARSLCAPLPLPPRASSDLRAFL